MSMPCSELVKVFFVFVNEPLSTTALTTVSSRSRDQKILKKLKINKPIDRPTNQQTSIQTL
jgi:hypothetical protein